MESIFEEQWWLLGGIVISFVLSILCQILVTCHVIRIVKESEKLEEEKPKYLWEWIEEYIKNENQIANVSVFADKKFYQLRIGKFTMRQIKHFSGQTLLLMIFLSGMGACLGIIEGNTLGEILPYYIISLVAIYIYFLLSGFINLEENKKIICRNVIDFLENKAPCWNCQITGKEEKNLEEVKDYFGEKEDLELKEIIREILV